MEASYENIENKVLSEVHVVSIRPDDRFKINGQEETGFSRFFYRSPNFFVTKNSSNCSKCKQAQVFTTDASVTSVHIQSNKSNSKTHLDEDGDHIVCRKYNERNHALVCKASDQQKHDYNNSHNNSNIKNDLDSIPSQRTREEMNVSQESHQIGELSDQHLKGEHAVDAHSFQNQDDCSKNCDSCVKTIKYSSEVNLQAEHDSNLEVMTMEHKMETVLSEVGFQVWSGALLLCDYLIDKCLDFQEATVLDLGAGTGLTSIMAAMFAPFVICTDYRGDIMELAERNWQRNKDLLPQVRCKQMSFKVLDWTWDYPLAVEPGIDAGGKFIINSEDVALIEQATIILGAEVIYDDDLTDAFFKIIYYLLVKPPTKSVLVSVEKRIIFSAESNDITSPAYEHFLENLEDLTTVDEGPVIFKAEQISTQFPQYFEYRRCKEMELWKISSHFPV